MSNNERHSDDGAHLPSAQGGAKFNALDPNDPKDQALVRSAMKRWPKRWRGLDDAKRVIKAERVASVCSTGGWCSFDQGFHVYV